MNFKLKVVVFLFFLNVACKKERYLNNNYKSEKKEQIQDTILPAKFLDKYAEKTFFKNILQRDKVLKKDLIRILKNQTLVHYDESKLDDELFFCQFIIEEEIMYNYCFRKNELIYKSTIPQNRAHFKFEYKDWNNDSKSDLITHYEEWEGGGNLGYRKIQSVFEVKRDTIIKIVDLPIENVFCQDGKHSNIELYTYKLNKYGNELTIKKTTGNGDCNSNKIKKVDSIKNKNIILNRFNNKVNI